MSEPALPLYTLSVTVTAEVAQRVTDALAEDGLAVSEFEEGDAWRVEVLVPGLPEQALVERVGDLAGGADVVVAPLPERDWLALNRRQFPPVRAGRFHVYSALDPGRPAMNLIRLRLDAGQAFGTGRHATTWLCLDAVDRLARRRSMGRVLDLGCGSGVLAMAAARVWRRAAVVAADIDPLAVDIARENIRANGLFRHVRTEIGDGLDDGPFDLILANILARPLIDMAGRIVAAVRPGGGVVLSGLLNGQEQTVIARYRAAGTTLVERRRRDGWSVLVFRK